MPDPASGPLRHFFAVGAIEKLLDEAQLALIDAELPERRRAAIDKLRQAHDRLHSLIAELYAEGEHA